jgi:hypothetical protein
MKTRRASLLLAAAALPVLAGPLRAAPPAPDPAASLQACVARLDSLDIGYERIVARCPGLTATLEDGPYAAWLPGDWKRPGNELSAAGLAQLQRLLAQELTTHPRAHVPQVAHLSSVLAQLPSAGKATPWRARLPGWLRHSPPSHAGAGGLVTWIGPVVWPPALAIYALLAVAVLLAALLSVRELHLAGLRLKGLPARPRHLPQPAVPAPAPERLGDLLAAVVTLLAGQGRLAGPQGLTARELASAAQLPPALQADFLALTRVAEALRYAAVPPTSAELAAAVRHGRRLLRGLTPPASP